MLKGESPVDLFGVKRSIAKAGAKWLLQYDLGSRVSPLRIDSFRVRMVRSTYPLALLLPTVIFRCTIPKESHNLFKLPWNSDPLSLRINLGLPQCVIMRW